MAHTIVYLVLFLATLAYGLALRTKQGKYFATEYTWARVAIGIAIVIAVAWFLIPATEWSKVALAFAVASVLIISRSLLNKVHVRHR